MNNSVITPMIVLVLILVIFIVILSYVNKYYNDDQTEFSFHEDPKLSTILEEDYNELHDEKISIIIEIDTDGNLVVVL